MDRADFSGLHDLEGICRFIDTYNNPLKCPDSDGETYDPSHECFYLGDKEVAPAEATPVGLSVRAPLQQTQPTRLLRERPTMSAHVGTHQAELEQLRELEAEVDEDR
jgi:hypothetical protein